jgi:antitoxin CcdA
MPSHAVPDRKRPVNVTLSEGLVAEAKVHTSNLSATIELLLSGFVVEQRQLQSAHRKATDVCADDWNAAHASVGSFADEHSTL